MATLNASSSRLELLEGYLREDPRNPGLLSEAVNAAIETGRHARAEELLDLLAQLEADSHAEHLRGMLRLAQHRFPEAAASFERVLAQAPSTPAARFNLGYALLRMGEFSRAAHVLRDVLNGDEAPPETLAYLMRSLLHAGQAADAVDAWRAHGERFRTAQTLGVASLASLDANELDQAVRLSELALRTASPPLEAFVVRGTLAIGDGQVELATRLLSEAAARSPDDGRVWSAMAAARMLQGDVAAALDAFMKATRLLPQHVGAWVSQAWCQILLRDLEGARASLQTALGLDRNFAETHGTLAVVDALQGHAAQARHAIEVALRLDPSSLAARYAESVLTGEAADAQAVRKLARRLLKGRTQLPAAELLKQPADRGE